MNDGTDCPSNTSTRALNWLDLVPIVLIAGLAFTISIDVLNTRPATAYPTGDVGMYSSVAANWLWPDSFPGDHFMAERQGTAQYLTVLSLQVGMLFRALFGDFGTAFSVMNFPLILAQGLGFYFLGRRLFGTPTRALLLVVACYLPAIGSYWYVQAYALARMWYMALLPFMLLAALRHGPNPRTWPWLMAGIGLSMHVHPVSAPVVGFATLIGLAALKPRSWSTGELLWRLFVAGLAFLAGAMPFVAVSFLVADHGPISDYETFLRIRSWYGNAFVSISSYVGGMVLRVNMAFILGGGVLGAAVALRMWQRDRTPLDFLVLWCLGLGIATIVFPWADHLVATSNETRPNLAEAVRGFRYMVPVAWILMLFAVFAVFDRALPAWRFAGRVMRPATAIAIVLVALFGAGTKLSSAPPYIFAWYQFVPFLPTLSCWSKGEFLCQRSRPGHLSPVIEHLKFTYPEGTRILPFVDRYRGAGVGQESLAAIIRFAAQRPVPFSFHERLLALYGDMSERGHIWRWLGLRSQYLEAFSQFAYHQPQPLPSLQALIDELDVDVLVTEVRLMDWQARALGPVTFRNEALTVIDVRDRARAPRP